MDKSDRVGLLQQTLEWAVQTLMQVNPVAKDACASLDLQPQILIQYNTISC